MNKQTVAIVGFGRFGKTLYRMLRADFNIILFNRTQSVFNNQRLTENTKVVKNIKSIYRADIIFYAVPIDQFKKVIKSHRQFFQPNHLLIDVLSVKEYPEKIFNKYLKGRKIQALLTHPMFGPDSSKNGFSGLNLMINQFKSSQENFSFWKEYFISKGINVVEMTAKKHDQLAAISQGTTHFIGRLLEKTHFHPTAIDTMGAKKLQEIVKQTCNDNWQLFCNLQTFNRYTNAMRQCIGRPYDFLYNQLLPKRISRKYLVFGIQGGKGSFNEQAVLDYIKRHKIKKFRIKYLYTSNRVLQYLSSGKIDFGLFAIHNAVGGVVWESARSMAKYKFKIIEEFPILISHFLMKRKDASISQATTIMAHPQVFLQCKQSLIDKYSKLKLISGKGDMIDTARSAQALSEGKVDKNILILGPKILAKMYNFEIVGKNMQDGQNNLTYFFLVSR